MLPLPVSMNKISTADASRSTLPMPVAEVVEAVEEDTVEVEVDMVVVEATREEEGGTKVEEGTRAEEVTKAVEVDTAVGAKVVMADREATADRASTKLSELHRSPVSFSDP